MRPDQDAVIDLMRDKADLLSALKYLLEREWQDNEGDATLELAREKARLAINQAESH